MATFDLTINEIAKIEGKCSLTVKVKDNQIEDLKFAISEYKRFYTQALRGKDIVAMPQLSCRICGTCSNAHLLCAIRAAENALGITPSEQTKLLRRLVNYGLNIRDHTLHLCVFVLPDLLGVDNILDLDENDETQRQMLEDTFMLKAAGNALGIAIGGKSVHAPYPTVGGFTKLPKQEELAGLAQKLQEARPAAIRVIEKFAACDWKLERELDFVAQIDDAYSLLEGSIVDTKGGVVAESDYGAHLEHVVIPHSHASGYKYDGNVFMVGAIARVNLAKDKLHPNTKQDAAGALGRFPSKNIHDNNLAQAIETLHFIDSAIDILQTIAIEPERPAPITKKAGTGVAAIEAPRGTLFYRVTINDRGIIEDIQIVVPTGQNQIGIEQSLYEFMKDKLEADRGMLAHEAEKIVRSYDPCMSCASHFLTLKWIEAD